MGYARPVSETRLPPKLAERFPETVVLGKGAYGRVLKATEAGTGKVVALKLLHPKLYEDPGMRRRFEREAQLTARIESPHVARVLDFGVERNRPYIVFEYVDGPDLESRLEEAGGRLPLPEAARIYLHLLEAIAAAHRHGVLHRDLKPDNVLLARDGRTVITDFGLSREFDSNSLTATGEMIGTATHMTPQQLLGEEADPSADLYAATLIFFEMASGEDAFRSKTFLELRDRKLRGLERGLRARGVAVPAALDALVARALAGTRDRRPRDAAAFLAEVRAALAAPVEAPGVVPPPGASDQDRGGSRARHLRALAVLVVLGLAALVSWLRG
jgi:serine/threonine-protein kinase